jgi:hypothetical protein
VRFSEPVQTGPVAHPTSCTMGNASFQVVKRLGDGSNRPPTRSAKVKERVQLYVYFLFSLRGRIQVNFTFILGVKYARSARQSLLLQSFIRQTMHFNLSNSTGYAMHQQIEHFNKCKLCPHCIYVFCSSLRTNSDLCHLHKKTDWFL